MKILRPFLSALAHVIFDDRCCACDRPLIITDAGHGVERAFCPLCIDALLPHDGHRCPCCAEAFDGGSASHLCPDCRRHPPSFDRIIAPWRYGGPLKDAIVRFKYGGQPDRCRQLAFLLSGQCPQDIDVVVPMPLHPGRLVRRGYNQSALIARNVARKSRLPLDTRSLRRVRSEPQVGKTRAERLAATVDAFHVPRPFAFAGRRVLLVDDVATTTATAQSAARCLRTQGQAAAVTVLCLARTTG